MPAHQVDKGQLMKTLEIIIRNHADHVYPDHHPKRGTADGVRVTEAAKQIIYYLDKIQII